MLERFDRKSESGRKNLVLAMAAQSLCTGVDAAVVGRLSDLVVLARHAPGEVIIEQGHASNDVFMIVAGTAEVLVDQRHIGLRKPGEHVGEMSAIDAAAPRCARVLAQSETITAKLSAGDLIELADAHPAIWRNLSKVLADRLRQRPVRARNEQAKVFIGSASEDLALVDQLMLRFDHKSFEPRPWTIGVIEPSGVTMDALLAQADSADFAVMLLGATDITVSRKKRQLSPRDNVILEYGLFAGALGRRERVFMVVPRGVELKLPSDLAGLRVLDYDTTKDLAIALAPVAIEISQTVARLGPR